ncbi:hypothetical protein P3S38_27570 [Enterobacter hormaechei]|uniref:hypothetical protein n=1 Tax=Enterobacter hormaechei TaxID=158836 RepID=UPI0023E3B9A8|nr:hypothetical protein [Enterobacter hormaechei]MDF3680742.1 hypothetical protein [Enterobacter hormaechei]
MDIVIIAKSMDIGHLNADQNLCGHQINQQKQKEKKVIIIGITIPGTVVIIVKNMDIYHRTA